MDSNTIVSKNTSATGSVSAAIRLDFGADEQRFALRIGELRELEELRHAGTGAIYRRCLTGDWHIDDVREIIRLGLIGGGMGPEKALKLTRLYVDERPWAESHLIALAVLDAAISGPPLEGDEEKEGKDSVGDGPPDPRAAAKGNGDCLSPPSMATGL